MTDLGNRFDPLKLKFRRGNCQLTGIGYFKMPFHSFKNRFIGLAVCFLSLEVWMRVSAAFRSLSLSRITFVAYWRFGKKMKEKTYKIVSSFAITVTCFISGCQSFEQWERSVFLWKELLTRVSSIINNLTRCKFSKLKNVENFKNALGNFVKWKAYCMWMHQKANDWIWSTSNALTSPMCSSGELRGLLLLNIVW